ncbi:MAG: hypothetical protein M3024_07100 [Candidatus Dormibacteraeota bacterium]|nr:hypothetical protein [Candidatus Dormibacteraeota bacterium]
MARALSFDPARVELELRTLPEIELKGIFRRSSNYTFLAELADPASGSRMLAVYKPAQGESPLWDFPPGSLYRREVAAYRLAGFLGWPRIPPTVVREAAPHGVGAMQMYVQADPALHYLTSGAEPRELWLPVALFDVLANNADRKSGHCLTDDEGAVWVIDHGLTFHAEPKLRTVMWDFAGERLTPRLRRDLRRAHTALQEGELRTALRGLLGRRELAALGERLAAAADPSWKMPLPDSSWSVPWPPV